jgi:ABC-2 type transport system ATP-binding protein
MATGYELLTLHGRLHGLSKAQAALAANALIDVMDLRAAAGRRVGSYSGGMKRRIDLACALVHLPRILFLDEPTEGLDPRSRRDVWDTLKRLNAALGMTVVLSTHYMEEANFLCDRLGIIDHGQIVVEGTPAELKARLGRQSVVVQLDVVAKDVGLERARRLLEDHDAIEAVWTSGTSLTAFSPDAARLVPHIMELLAAAGIDPLAVSVKQPTLDEVYLRYTGRYSTARRPRPPPRRRPRERDPDLTAGPADRPDDPADPPQPCRPCLLAGAGRPLLPRLRRAVREPH